jgi:hypothetical protein
LSYYVDWEQHSDWQFTWSEQLPSKEKEIIKFSSGEVLRYGRRKRKVKGAPVSPSGAEIPQNEISNGESLKYRRNLWKEF